MSTINRSGSMQVLAKLFLIVSCVLCLQVLCSCASKPGDEGVADHAIKYADSRVMLDMSASCVVRNTPDAQVDISLMSFEETPGGIKEIKLEPAVVSDTMASWTADEWAQNRDDLYFNLVAHFNVICMQANTYGGISDEYVVTCPDYMVVYDSQKNNGYIVSSSGVNKKTNDPQNPFGEAVVFVAQS